MTGIAQLLEDLPSPPYLITGATGFIGRHLTGLFEQHGIPVHLLVRTPSKLGKRPASTRIFQGDVTDPAGILHAMEGCNAVFHLASYVDIWAKDPGVFYQINVDGTRNICEAARRLRIQRLVVTSTAGTLGDSASGVILHEGIIPKTEPMNAYEASKRAAEKVVQEYARSGLHAVVVMPSRVFGPGSRDKSNGYAVAMERYVQGKLRFIPGTGREIGNYAFVHDVVMGHLLAMVNGKSGERYLLGGENLSFRDIFKQAGDAMHVSYRMIPVPYLFLYLFALAAMGYSRLTGRRPAVTPEYTRRFRINYILDLGKSVRELGYQVTPFREAVRTTLEGLDAP